MEEQLYKLSNLNGFYADFTNLQLRKDIKDVYYLWMCELQKWLRDEYKIIIGLDPYVSLTGELNFQPDISVYLEEVKIFELIEFESKGYSDYKLALEEGLLEVLKILK